MKKPVLFYLLFVVLFSGCSTDPEDIRPKVQSTKETSSHAGTAHMRTAENNQGKSFSDAPAPENWIISSSYQWMKNLADGTYLRDVSLPGTHDSGAVHGVFARTQSWSIAEQLSAGIRFFDIRCRRAGTDFAIHHGPVFQKQMMSDVMQAFTSFLSENPSESIVIRLKEEHEPTSGSETFLTIWSRYKIRYASYLYNNKNSLPTVGDVRGKIYVMSNYGGSDGKDMDYGEASDIQDRYKVYNLPWEKLYDDDGATLPSKKKEIIRYISRAKDSPLWVLNYLSGSTGMSSAGVARQTNEATFNHIRAIEKQNLGIIICDFPGEGIIHEVIQSNF